MNELMIEASGLSRRFGTTDVLTSVDLAIPRGMVVGLLGTNGCGKSTLIKCLLGLLRASGGTARLFGEDPWDLSGAAKARLGYVPQDVKLYPWMTVAQVISYTAAFYPTWDFALSEHLVQQWDLPRESRVGPLSPGQIQKLGLILALGHRPELLILDEPVASLDPVARREFLKSLLEVTQDEKHTVLFSTHITSDLERVASHVAILKKGKVELFEDLDTVKDRIKRLRISATEPLPRSFAVEGALRTEVEGRVALVAATNVSEHMVNDLRSRWQAEVTVEDLNLEEISLGFPGFEDLQAKLPDVAVRPAFVDVSRMSWFLMVVFLNAAVLGLIALQLRSHFAHPGAHLIPAYTWPHLVPPLFLWIGSIVNILPLLALGVPIIPAIGVHAACWASMTGIVIVSTILQLIARLPRWIATPVGAVAGAVLGGWLPLILLAVFRFPSSVDWYLRGNEPWVEFALIVLGAVLPLILILRSRRLYSVYLENGCDSPVLGLDLISIRSLQRRAYQRNDMPPHPRWPQWLLGANLETVIAKSRNGGWRERCRLWIAGNALSGRVVPLLMGFGAILFVPAQVVQFGFADYQSDLRPLMLISVLIPDFGMIFFLKQWWIRRSLFGMELLRPNSRQEYIRQMMGAIAWDLGPQGCVYLGLFAMLVTLADSTRMSVGWVIAMLLVAVSRWVLVYGMILWLLLIRRDWLVFVTAVFAVYAMLIVNVGMLMLQASILGVRDLPPDLPEFGAGLVAAVAVAIGLIGATVAAAAYRRWQSVELA